MGVATHPDPCVRCGCRIVPAGVWRAAEKPQRATWGAEGLRRAARSNMCTACHTWLREHDQLDQWAPRRAGDLAGIDGDNPWTACRRCGQPDRHTGDLCADCVETTALMGERDRWVA